MGFLDRWTDASPAEIRPDQRTTADYHSSGEYDGNHRFDGKFRCHGSRDAAASIQLAVQLHEHFRRDQSRAGVDGIEAGRCRILSGGGDEFLRVSHEPRGDADRGGYSGHQLATAEHQRHARRQCVSQCDSVRGWLAIPVAEERSEHRRRYQCNARPHQHYCHRWRELHGGRGQQRRRCYKRYSGVEDFGCRFTTFARQLYQSRANFVDQRRVSRLFRHKLQRDEGTQRTGPRRPNGRTINLVHMAGSRIGHGWVEHLWKHVRYAAGRLYRDELDELGRGRLQRRRRKQRSGRFDEPVFRQRRAFQCGGGDGVPNRFGRIHSGVSRFCPAGCCSRAFSGTRRQWRAVVCERCLGMVGRCRIGRGFYPLQLRSSTYSRKCCRPCYQYRIALDDRIRSLDSR